MKFPQNNILFQAGYIIKFDQCPDFAWSERGQVLSLKFLGILDNVSLALRYLRTWLSSLKLKISAFMCYRKTNVAITTVVLPQYKKFSYARLLSVKNLIQQYRLTISHQIELKSILFYTEV